MLQLFLGLLEQALATALGLIFRKRGQGTNLVSKQMKHVVILGGGYAAVPTAHRLLKATTTLPTRVTIVSPNTDLYWSMAAPRGFIRGEIAEEKLFQPIEAGFDRYVAGQVDFSNAVAESLEVESKTVRIKGTNIDRDLSYDYLVLATGSHTEGTAPFKGIGSTEATKQALHEIQAEIEEAQSIVVAGAGVTGVETAGELATRYGRTKEIVLVSNASIPSCKRRADSSTP